jgi:hypothetical protein
MLHVPRSEIRPARIAEAQGLRYVLGMKRSGLFVVAMAIAALAAAQTPFPGAEKWLQPNETEITGSALDAAGKPVADAWIEDAMFQGREGVIPADGRFHFKTRVPAFVVRAFGYQGVYVKLPTTSPVRIVMKPIAERLAECGNLSSCWSKDVPNSRLCLLKTPGVEKGKPRRDIDYLQQFYHLSGHHPKAVLSHGSGPMWSYGVPNEADVWSSVEYSERTLQAGSGNVVDARGKKADGTLWRFVGELEETVEYETTNAASAELFDRMLDGVCVFPERPK